MRIKIDNIEACILLDALKHEEDKIRKELVVQIDANLDKYYCVVNLYDRIMACKERGE